MVKKSPKQKPVPVKIVSDYETASPRVDDSWRVRDALSTLQRAREIESDKGLMKQVKTEAKKMASQLAKVCK